MNLLFSSRHCHYYLIISLNIKIHAGLNLKFPSLMSCFKIINNNNNNLESCLMIICPIKLIKMIMKTLSLYKVFSVFSEITIKLSRSYFIEMSWTDVIRRMNLGKVLILDIKSTLVSLGNHLKIMLSKMGRCRVGSKQTQMPIIIMLTNDSNYTANPHYRPPPSIRSRPFKKDNNIVKLHDDH